MSSGMEILMNPETGKPWGSADGGCPVGVPVEEQVDWERSWIGRQTLLALMPLRECPARDVGSQR